MLMTEDSFSHRYKILRVLGHGGMSAVYLALDRQDNKLYAVKEVKKEAGAFYWKNALAEANLMKALQHELIPGILGVFEDDIAVHMVMDYIAGQPLDAFLREQGRLSVRQTVDIGLQLCDVTDYLHSCALLYLDIKPSNLMLTDPHLMRIKVPDLGIAKRMSNGAVCVSKFAGTRGFAAPEQYRENSCLDIRTDVFGLGATLFTLATGHVLQQAQNKSMLQYPYTPFEQTILRCIQEDPQDRYQNCRQVKQALEQCPCQETTSPFTATKEPLGMEGSLFCSRTLGADTTQTNEETVSEYTVPDVASAKEKLGFLPKNALSFTELALIFRRIPNRPRAQKNRRRQTVNCFRKRRFPVTLSGRQL